jgi:hypothetical protein
MEKFGSGMGINSGSATLNVILSKKLMWPLTPANLEQLDLEWTELND